MSMADGSRSLAITSDEALCHLCDPCKFKGTQTNANHFCKNCKEYLCRSCKESHQSFKATRKHKIIASTSVRPDGQTIAQYQLSCTCDQALMVEIYCEKHNEVVCTTCKNVNHRKCSNVTTIREKGTTYKVSDIQKIIQNVHSLEEEIKQFRQDRDADVQRIESMVEKAREKIKSFRRDLDIFFDSLENNMLTELEQMAKTIRYDAEKHKPTCTNTLKSLDNDIKTLDTASESANTEVMFAADVRISKRLTELRAMMKDFQDEVKPPFLEFKANKKLLEIEQVKRLGTLKINESESAIADSSTFLNMKIRNSQSYSCKDQNDKENPLITGSIFMPNGQLLLCDHNNNNVKLLNSMFDIKMTMALDGRPWDISAINSTKVIVTLPNIKQLQFIDIVPTLKVDKHIKLDKQCYGVDVVRDEIYVICHDSPGNAEIRVFDNNGTFIRKVPTVSNNLSSLDLPYYIAVVETSFKIYLSWGKVSSVVSPLMVDWCSFINKMVYDGRDP